MQTITATDLNDAFARFGLNDGEIFSAIATAGRAQPSPPPALQMQVRLGLLVIECHSAVAWLQIPRQCWLRACAACTNMCEQGAGLTAAIEHWHLPCALHLLLEAQSRTRMLDASSAPAFLFDTQITSFMFLLL